MGWRAVAIVFLAAGVAGRSAGQAESAAVAPTYVVVPQAQPAAEPAILLPILRKIWSDGIELGLNGASGNSDLFNLRAGWNGEWRSAGNLLHADFVYLYATQGGATTVQQALFNARAEAAMPDGGSAAYWATQVEYDELRAYRLRVGMYPGFGYTLADDGAALARARLGGGRVREFGSGRVADRWVWELAVGYDVTYRLSDRTSLQSVFDYYPRATDVGQFRLRGRLALEYVLDPASGAFLRVGVQDRYDSDPGNGVRNDLQYYTTLGFQF